MKSKLAKNINRNKSKYLCSMQAASTSTLTLSLSLSPSPSLSATPRRARHGRTCAKYLDVSFYFGAGAARVGGSSLICILSALQKERDSGRERERETASQAGRGSEGEGELSPPATAEIHWKSAQKGRASFALVSALGYLEMPLAILAMLAELPYIKVSCSGPSAYKYVRVALTVAALRQVASQLSTRNQITHTQPPAGHAKQCRQLRLQLKLLLPLPLPLQIPFPSSSDALCMSSAVLRERGLKVLTDVGRGRGV